MEANWRLNINGESVDLRNPEISFHPERYCDRREVAVRLVFNLSLEQLDLLKQHCEDTANE